MVRPQPPRLCLEFPGGGLAGAIPDTAGAAVSDIPGAIPDTAAADVSGIWGSER